jgi:curved DNA-binding protein CbpA
LSGLFREAEVEGNRDFLPGEGYTDSVVEKDWYVVLGVAPDSDLPTIRKAYHKLALLHHPDRNKGSKESEEKFREVAKAYAILSDERTRKVFDRERLRPQPRPAPGGAYTAPAPQGEEGWSETRKYEAVKNSYFWKASERRRAQNEQRSQRGAPGGTPGPQKSVFDLSAWDDLPGTGIQAPWDAGTPIKIVGTNAPTLGESIRIVNPMGPIPQFSLWRKKPDA